MFKGNPKVDKVGPKLQLLFIKPKEKEESKDGNKKQKDNDRLTYLEACIYEMDLKAGKRYHLFLASQPGVGQGGKGQLARYVMTSPPILASKKSARKIASVTCPKCGKFFLYNLKKFLD